MLWGWESGLADLAIAGSQPFPDQSRHQRRRTGRV